MGVLVVSCIFAAVLGFAAHRASICNVKAGAEVISTGRFYLLAGILKAVIWVFVLTVPYLMLMPSASERLIGSRLSAATLFGGFVFGWGAAINGGCAFSTLARLADGQIAMLCTLGGFLLGVLCYFMLIAFHWMVMPLSIASMAGLLGAFAVALCPPLLIWALYESIRLWRTQPRRSGVRKLLLATQYRLSTAAMLIGLANGGLYLIYGGWGYTGTLYQATEATVAGGSFPPSNRWFLFAALLIGMILSTWQRGSFRIEWRPERAWGRNIFGGLLMGLGAALVPGGNDALVLYGIPSLSPHAVPSYLAMIVGVAAALLAMRFWLGIETRVECRGDICVIPAAAQAGDVAPPATQAASLAPR
jgi:uncharacterized protein